jgi:hypothetical protein
MEGETPRWVVLGNMRPSQDAQAQVSRLADVVHWRGDRDEREWPRALIAGGHWPWRGYSSAPGSGRS